MMELCHKLLKYGKDQPRDSTVTNLYTEMFREDFPDFLVITTGNKNSALI